MPWPKFNRPGYVESDNPCKCKDLIEEIEWMQDLITKIRDRCKAGGSVPCESILSIIRRAR